MQGEGGNVRPKKKGRKWIDAAFTSSIILKKHGEQDEMQKKTKKGMYEFKGKGELPQRLGLLMNTYF